METVKLEGMRIERTVTETPFKKEYEVPEKLYLVFGVLESREHVPGCVPASEPAVILTSDPKGSLSTDQAHFSVKKVIEFTNSGEAQMPWDMFHGIKDNVARLEAEPLFRRQEA